MNGRVYEAILAFGRCRNLSELDRAKELSILPKDFLLAYAPEQIMWVYNHLPQHLQEDEDIKDWLPCTVCFANPAPGTDIPCTPHHRGWCKEFRAACEMPTPSPSPTQREAVYIGEEELSIRGGVACIQCKKLATVLTKARPSCKCVTRDTETLDAIEGCQCENFDCTLGSFCHDCKTSFETTLPKLTGPLMYRRFHQEVEAWLRRQRSARRNK